MHLSELAAEDPAALDEVTEVNWKRLLELANSHGKLQEACEIGITNYGASGCYEDANDRFSLFISPMLDRIDAARMRKLLEAIDNNSQTYDRRRAKEDHQKISSAAEALVIDTSAYQNFEANI